MLPRLPRFFGRWFSIAVGKLEETNDRPSPIETTQTAIPSIARAAIPDS